MKASLKRALGGSAVLATATGLMFSLGAGAAHAATTPPWEPDPSAVGTITFYDANGSVITGGSLNDTPFATYASGNVLRAGDQTAAMFFFLPNPTSTPDNWSGDQLSGFTSYPITSGPASIQTLSQSKPVVTSTNQDLPLSFFVSEFPNGAAQQSNTAYQNMYQVRLKSADSTGLQTAQYDDADIMVDPATNTWQQVYPAPAPKVATSISAITASPISPAPQGTTSVNLSASLSASDSSHPAGSVELFNGSSDLGAATLDAATGNITATAAVTDSTSYGFTFVYTPSGNYSGSSSPSLNYAVNGPAAATTTTVTGPSTATVGDLVSYTAAVTTGSGEVPATAGSVQFSVNGKAVGAPVALTATGAKFQYNASTAGSFTVTAAFTPATGQNYAASTDAVGASLVVSAGTTTPDPQNVVVTVPTGSLTISTPYTVDNPFNLGTMNLNADGTELSTSAQFGDPAAAAATDPGAIPAGSTTVDKKYTNNGVTVTDTRPGSTGWTASAQTTDFDNGSGAKIDGDNLSLTSVTAKYLAGNALQSGDVSTNSITGFKSAKKSFATTAKGPGTVDITGVMGLTAPTSTVPGLYTATITFTVS